MMNAMAQTKPTSEELHAELNDLRSTATRLIEQASCLMESGDEQAVIASAKGTFPADPGDTTEGWGILEASRRIAAVRSTSVAHTQAVRSLPPPPRDSDGRAEKSDATPTSLDDLLKEELR